MTYQYDSLNRMIQATSSSGWGEAYAFDGFGNLTTKTGSGGAPQLSVVVSAVNNQIQQVSGLTYDNNGNELYGGVTYDAENRIATVPGLQYAYDARNKRIWSWAGGTDPSGWGNASGYNIFLYSPGGQRLGTYQITVYNNGISDTNLTLQSTLITSDLFFGGRRLAVEDRLGSVGSYFPYGEARTGTNPLDIWSFATYWRDSATSLDYADQRYYSNQFGRFMSPDPYYGSASTRVPQSWNRYAYVWNDPINGHDPSGLCDIVVAGIAESSLSDTGEAQLASNIGGAMLAYPYAGSNIPTGVFATILSTFFSTVETKTAAAAIEAAADDSSGPINIFAFSGGAAATSAALSGLPASVTSRISSITYVSPGTAGALSTVNGITPTVINGAGDADLIATLVGAALMPTGWNIIATNAPHNFGEEIGAAVAGGWMIPVGNPCNQPITFSAYIANPLNPTNTPRGFYSDGYSNPPGYDPFDSFSNPQSAVTSTITYNLGNP